jgi:hypothetical protein
VTSRHLPPARRRSALRAGVVCGVATLSTVVAASPVFALERDDGDDPGKPLEKMDALLIFAGIPIASLILIWIMCSIPSMFKKH